LPLMIDLYFCFKANVVPVTSKKSLCDGVVLQFSIS
jgi:hypothetical protein